MNIKSKRALGKLISFKSANEKIDVSITDSNNGPIIILEDNSTVQFTDILQYYDVMTDNEIYNIDEQSFDIEKFQEKYLIDSDDVNRIDIDEVEKYIVDDKDLYRFIAS
jgi:hypothetical protein